MSLQLLNRLLGSASGAGTAVLCTCSKNGEMDVMTSLEPLVREDRITVVRLEPFTEEETEEILRRELPDVAKEAGKCRSIYKTTEGNAFFLREMINLIRKRALPWKNPPRPIWPSRPGCHRWEPGSGRSWNVCPCSRKRSVSRSWNI